MKKIISLTLTLILCASLTAPAAAMKFTDVPSNHWAHSAIQLAAARGVVSGYADGTFLPAANVTNAQFVVMLSRSFYAQYIDSSDERAAAQPWWWPNWFALTRNGILENNETFSNLDVFKENAGNALSRYDMALLISGVLDEWGRKATDEQKLEAQEAIADYASIPAQYQEAVKESFALGLITGYSDGSFSGEKTMNRAQGCVVMERLTRILNGLTAQQAPAEPSANQAETTTSTLKLRNGKAATEDNAIEIINEVMMVYPIGSPWDESRTKGAGLRDNDVEIGGRVLGTMSSALSTINTHYKVSMQRACGGFAGVVSDAIFGGGNTGGNNFPARKIDDVLKIRPGDIVMLFDSDNKPQHVIAATSGIIRTEQFEGEEVYIFNYCDGNADECVSMDSAYFPRSKPSNWSYEIWTRYPS